MGPARRPGPFSIDESVDSPEDGEDMAEHDRCVGYSWCSATHSTAAIQSMPTWSDQNPSEDPLG